MRGHLLSLLLCTPLLGALVLAVLPGRKRAWLRTVLAAASLLTLGWAGVVLVLFDRLQPGNQFTERADWIPALGAQYLLELDGLSLVFVLLTLLAGGAAALFSGSTVRYREKEFYSLLLLQQAALLGLFLSGDLLLFTLFFMASVVPLYFLLGIWGSEQGSGAALKFVVYTTAGSALLTLAVALLGLAHQAQFGTTSLEMAELVKLRLPPEQQMLIGGLLLGAFAIRMPLFPFHGWLPDALTEAPGAGSVILAGLLVQTGIYGFVRVALPLAPQVISVPAVQDLIAVLAVLSISYGGVACLVQGDWKKALAFVCLTHGGVCTLGLLAMNKDGVGGGVLQSLNYGVAASLLFLMVGMMYERRRTRLVAEFGGVALAMPRFGRVFALALLGSAGIPVLAMYSNSFSVLRGVFSAHFGLAVLLTLGIASTAAYLLWLYQRTMRGLLTNPQNVQLPDFSRLEWLVVLPLTAIILLIALYPAPLADMLREPVEAVIRRIR